MYYKATYLPYPLNSKEFEILSMFIGTSKFEHFPRKSNKSRLSKY